MEIIENNKLIAEFMGVDYEDLQNLCKDELYSQGHRSDAILNDVEYWSCYHSSWDWLMPVVEKIETLNNNGFDFDIFTEGVIITMYRKDNDADLNEGLEIIRNTRCEISFENKLEVCYISVIEFINWYSTKL